MPSVRSGERTRPATVALGLLAPVNRRAAAALRLERTLARADGVALTFDDGPHPEGTPAILEILEREAMQAVFFLVGEQVRQRPEMVARIVSAGHLVALHGYRHRLQLRMSRGELVADLEHGIEVLRDAAGVAPAWHRPPYGIYSPWGLDAVRAASLRPLLWSRWGKDWRRFTTPARIAGRASRGLSPGDVILLHDADFYSARGSHRRTVMALPGIIAELKRRGLGTVLPV